MSEDAVRPTFKSFNELEGVELKDFEFLHEWSDPFFVDWSLLCAEFREERLRLAGAWCADYEASLGRKNERLEYMRQCEEKLAQGVPLNGDMITLDSFPYLVGDFCHPFFAYAKLHQEGWTQ